MWVSSDQVKEKALSEGFDKVGIALVEREDKETMARLRQWLALGYHADMGWMTNPKRENLKDWMPQVRSVISVALNYYTNVERPSGKKYAKISRYGWGKDYHKVMKKKLKGVSDWLKSQGSGIEAIYYADTGPVADKVWAQKAGLGWIAKNGNLITREYGSWVFLGEILTNVELSGDQPHGTHCGTCTRCLDACPTGAIAEPFVVDANRCIAYHTIENRADELPFEIAGNLEGWVAGCDICQDVCPWNQRFAVETNVEEFKPYPENIGPTLSDLANITWEEWDQRFRGSALRRIKLAMLRRNACANLD